MQQFTYALIAMLLATVSGCSQPTSRDASPEALTALKKTLSEEKAAALEVAINWIMNDEVGDGGMFGGAMLANEQVQRRIRERLSDKTADEILKEGSVAGAKLKLKMKSDLRNLFAGEIVTRLDSAPLDQLSDSERAEIAKIKQLREEARREAATEDAALQKIIDQGGTTDLAFFQSE